MQLIEPLAASSSIEGVLAHREELASRYRAFYLSLWQTGVVEDRVLELCRLRVARIHGADAEWSLRHPGVGLTDEEISALQRGDTGTFTDGERAALALAEEVPFNHHGVTDDLVAEAVEHLGQDATVALLTATAFFDVTCRLKLTLGIPAHPGELSGEHLV